MDAAQAAIAANLGALPRDLASVTPAAVVAISGWDDADLLGGCLASVSAQGWPVVYLDGAYRTYAPRGEWRTPDAALAPLRVRWPFVAWYAAPQSGPWETEAEKRTAVLGLAVLQARARGIGWVLCLDTDERVVGPPGALQRWLDAEDGRESLWWAMVNLYSEDRPGLRAGYLLPRLIRVADGLAFHPPRDFELYRGGVRMAYLEGEVPSGADAGRWAAVPRNALRIRHDRAQRPARRLAQSGSYIRVREGRPIEGDTTAW